GCPDWKPGRQRPTRVDAYAEHVDRQIAAGCRNAAAVYRELAAQGCPASAAAVLRFFNRRLAAAGQKRERVNAAAPARTGPPSARKLAFEFIRRSEDREPAEEQRLDRIRGVDVHATDAVQPLFLSGLPVLGSPDELESQLPCRRRARARGCCRVDALALLAGRSQPPVEETEHGGRGRRAALGRQFPVDRGRVAAPRGNLPVHVLGIGVHPRRSLPPWLPIGTA